MTYPDSVGPKVNFLESGPDSELHGIVRKVGMALHGAGFVGFLPRLHY